MQRTQCFNLSYFVLIVAGVWYPRSLDNTRILYAVNIYRVFAMVLVLFGMLSIQFIYFFTVFGEDLDKTVDATALFTFVGHMYKAITVIIHRQRINKLLDIIDDETDKDDLLRNMAANINLLSKFYNGGACLTAVMWNLIPFTKATLTLPFYYPDLPPTSPWFIRWYLYQATILIINGVAQTSADHLFGGLMAFAATQLKLLQNKLETIGTRTENTKEVDASKLFTFAQSQIQGTRSQAGAAADQAQILKRRKSSSLLTNYEFAALTVKTRGPWSADMKDFIKALSPRLINTSGDPRAGAYLAQGISLAIQRAQKEQNDYEEIISCVKYHLKIIRFVNELTDIFGGPAFLQFLLAAPLLCLSMFMFKTSTDPTELGTRLLYFGCISGQLFIYCFCGNMIKTQSDLVATAAYNSSWTSTSVRTQKALQLLVIRGQKTLSVVAGNLFELSLVTFGALLKSSYSFFAVLSKQSDD